MYFRLFQTRIGRGVRLLFIFIFFFILSSSFRCARFCARSAFFRALSSSRMRNTTSISSMVPEKDGYHSVHGAGFQGRADVMKVLLDHGVYRSLDDRTRRTWCKLWRGLIANDDAEMRAAVADLGVDPELTTFFRIVLALVPARVVEDVHGTSTSAAAQMSDAVWWS